MFPAPRASAVLTFSEHASAWLLPDDFVSLDFAAYALEDGGLMQAPVVAALGESAGVPAVMFSPWHGRPALVPASGWQGYGGPGTGMRPLPDLEVVYAAAEPHTHG